MLAFVPDHGLLLASFPGSTAQLFSHIHVAEPGNEVRLL